MDKFWLGLIRFAFRRLRSRDRRIPVGIPAMRDPDAVCEAYAPRRWRLGDWRDCDSDGHYLCRECIHLKGDDETVELEVKE